MATNDRPARSDRASRKPGRTARVRARILSEWRGCDEPTNLNSRVNRAGAFIDAILKSAGLSEGIHEQEIKTAWKEIAGEFIARNSEPASVKGGVLVLRVTQPSMRFQLEQMKPMLLGRIRTSLGEAGIRSIKFTLG